MSPPIVVRVRRGDALWWVVSASYPSAHMARTVWERLDRKMRTGHAGFYRHGTSTAPGCRVSVVSPNHDEAATAARLLKDGQNEPLEPMVAQALIARRVDVVLQAADQGIDSGRLRWRRPERGASLRPDGSMHEPGGQG